MYDLRSIQRVLQVPLTFETVLRKSVSSQPSHLTTQYYSCEQRASNKTLSSRELQSISSAHFHTCTLQTCIPSNALDSSRYRGTKVFQLPCVVKTEAFAALINEHEHADDGVLGTPKDRDGLHITHLFTCCSLYKCKACQGVFQYFALHGSVLCLHPAHSVNEQTHARIHVRKHAIHEHRHTSVTDSD